jgi:hypothetical protein
MSVIVTVRFSGDPAAFEEHAAAQAETLTRIMGIAKSHGLIAHRWYGGDGEFMAIDEWPDAESFPAFFDEAQAHIAPLMEAAGVSSPPQVSVWRALDVPDAFGWGA